MTTCCTPWRPCGVTVAAAAARSSRSVPVAATAVAPPISFMNVRRVSMCRPPSGLCQDVVQDLGHAVEVVRVLLVSRQRRGRQRAKQQLDEQDTEGYSGDRDVM